MTIHTEANCTDLPHIVLSLDIDEPLDGPMVWRILANHAEFEVARPAIEEYVEEVEGVEEVYVECARIATGAELRESVEEDLAEMRNDPDLMTPEEAGNAAIPGFEFDPATGEYRPE